jgi:hypothetical protein
LQSGAALALAATPRAAIVPPGKGKGKGSDKDLRFYRRNRRQIIPLLAPADL